MIKIVDTTKGIDETSYVYAVCECHVFGEAIQIDRPERSEFIRFKCPNCGKELGDYVMGKIDKKLANRMVWNSMNNYYLYECDPDKNTDCTKETCGDPCRMTSHIEFSNDGKIVALRPAFYDEIARRLLSKLDHRTDMKDPIAHVTYDPDLHFGIERWTIRVSFNTLDDEEIGYSHIFNEKDIIESQGTPDPEQYAEMLHEEITAYLSERKKYMEEKHAIITKAYTGHMYFMSPYECYDNCGTCDGAKCDACHEWWEVTYYGSDKKSEFFDKKEDALAAKEAYEKDTKL